MVPEVNVRNRDKVIKCRNIFVSFTTINHLCLLPDCFKNGNLHAQLLTPIAQQFLVLNDHAVSCFSREFFGGKDIPRDDLDFQNKSHCKTCEKEYRSAR